MLFKNISTKNLQHFEQQIFSANWSAVLSSASADKAFDYFLDKFIMRYDRWFPYQQRNIFRKSRKLWVTSEIRKIINKKNALYHQIVRSRDVSVLAKFKEQRNRCTRALRQSKRYFNNLFQGVNGFDVIWKKLNGILKTGPHKEIITKIKIEGTDIDEEALAEKFNEHFVMPAQSVCFMSASRYMLSVSDSLFFTPTDDEEVFSAFQNLIKTTEKASIYTTFKQNQLNMY